MTKDKFQEYEGLPKGYFKDKRWQKVRELRRENKQPEANGLVMAIRSDWGFE